MGFINSKRYNGVQLYYKSNKDISYYIRFRDDNNKLKRIKIGDKSKGITEHYCNQKRNEIINSIKLGTDLPIKTKKKKGISLDTVAIKYLDDLKLHSNENTIRDRKNKYYKHLFEYFRDIEIEKITSEDLENLQKEKIKTLSPKTVNQITEMFSTIFNYGIRKELCKTINPTTKIKRFTVDNTRERYLIDEEIFELYEIIKDNKLLTLFVRFALTTGGRLETVLHIQKKDITLISETITLYDFKNKNTYRGFLTDEILKIIKPLMKKLKANDYLISLDGTKLTSRQIQSRLKPKLDKLFNKELDIKDRKNRVVIHTLRHTFASHLAIQGTPIYTIQKLMNHKDIKQTMRYAKLAPNSGKDFVQKLYL